MEKAGAEEGRVNGDGVRDEGGRVTGGAGRGGEGTARGVVVGTRLRGWIHCAREIFPLFCA